jgi:hypothetical protein
MANQAPLTCKTIAVVHHEPAQNLLAQELMYIADFQVRCHTWQLSWRVAATRAVPAVEAACSLRLLECALAAAAAAL